MAEFLFCGYRDQAKASPDKMSMTKPQKMKALWGSAEEPVEQEPEQGDLSAQNGFITLYILPLKNTSFSLMLFSCQIFQFFPFSKHNSIIKPKNAII